MKVLIFWAKFLYRGQMLILLQQFTFLLVFQKRRSIPSIILLKVWAGFFGHLLLPLHSDQNFNHKNSQIVNKIGHLWYPVKISWFRRPWKLVIIFFFSIYLFQVKNIQKESNPSLGVETSRRIANFRENLTWKNGLKGLFFSQKKLYV